MDLKELQYKVAQSKTTKQCDTSTMARALFISHETGAVMRALLELRGYYGTAAIDVAKERLGDKLCNLIWNICDLASEVDIDLQLPMVKLLEKNAKRTWGKDDA